MVGFSSRPFTAMYLFVFSVTTPPTISKHPSREVAYKVGEKVEIECEAAGEPVPR